MASTTQSVSPTQKKKTLHTVVFDVSGSMRAPLKLRSNSRDANKSSGGLEPKRVQTVFDVICRLAEDAIGAAKEQDMYVAVLCFGLRPVRTCDLLAFLEERTKTLELLDGAEGHETAGLSYQQAAELLAVNGIYSSEAQGVLRVASDGSSSSGPQLYTVIGRRPLVRLLARAGAPYCEEYVQKRMTPKSAGKYFMSFAVPGRAKDLDAVVASLPNACKYRSSSLAPKATRAGAGLGVGVLAAMLIPEFGIPLAIGLMMATYRASGQIEEGAQQDAVNEATRFADDLIAAKDKEDALATLKSNPFATPKPVITVVQLVKRLQSMLKQKGEMDTATDDNRSSAKDSQSTFINWERLLDDIEPYLYGSTPMCQALRSVRPLFQDQTYSSKGMMLISDGDATDGDPLPPTQALRDAGGTIFACLLTNATIEEPRQLYGSDEAGMEWSSTVRTMFDMASIVSCDSEPVQALRRRGWKLPVSGQCKLFIQANNPMIIDEFTSASRQLGTSSDALAEIIGQISLDEYIQKSNEAAKVTDQGPRSICWAHATGSVIHLASHRVVGRKAKDFLDIRMELLDEFGNNDSRQHVGTVLHRICPKYKLRFKECDEVGARAAIHARRPVVATFWLDGNRWNKFGAPHNSTPKGTLTANDMSAVAGGKGGGGHAVVLVRCDETSLSFMNSWGPMWANNGFFTIDNSSTLGILGGPPMRFYDVYWTTDDLSTQEVASWKEHARATGRKVIDVLPKSFHDLPVVCPRCKRSAPANDYGGSWYEANCRACKGTFTPTGRALLQSLYDSNYN